MNTIVIASLENGVLENSLKGGLGILERDLFEDLKISNIPDDTQIIFISPFYGKVKKQELREGKVYFFIKDVKPQENGLILEDKFVERIKNENVEFEVYKFPKSNEKVKSYFLFCNQFNHPLYESGSAENELKTDYYFAKGSKRFFERNNIYPEILILNESDTAFFACLFPYSRTIFWTHTPQEWGHKKFDISLFEKICESDILEKLKEVQKGDKINLGLFLAMKSDKIMCVSRNHYKITTQEIYPQFKDKIYYITNGVARDWIGYEWQKIYDKYFPGWRNNTKVLENVRSWDDEIIKNIKDRQIKNSNEFIEKLINENLAIGNFDPKKPSLIYAKRLTRYKNPQKCLEIITNKANIVVAGPVIDNFGEEVVKNIYALYRKGELITFIPNYDIPTAKNLVKNFGWLFFSDEGEASGTSFMKALINGTIVISTPVGSVPEFVKDGENGFIIKLDFSDLKEKVEKAIDLYYNGQYVQISKKALSTYEVLMERYIEEFFFNKIIYVTSK